jgi:hypothetical protein
MSVGLVVFVVMWYLGLLALLAALLAVPVALAIVRHRLTGRPWALAKILLEILLAFADE